MPTTEKRPAEFAEGDMIDLEGRDQVPGNAVIWENEYASVESVSTFDKRCGGWVDALLDAPGSRNLAIVYNDNGASPAVILADRTYTVVTED